MEINYFDIMLKIGSLSGLISVLWLVLKDINKWHKKPKLKIEFDESVDVKEYNFVDTGWHRKFFNLRVRNTAKETAKRCVAVLTILEKPENATNIESSYTLHWAGVDYSLQTTGAEPIDLGFEIRRLDVVFTDENINNKGCFAAIPIALSLPQNAGQAFLPEGEYVIEVSVNCENGKGDKMKFKIISPKTWNELKVSVIK